MSTLSPWLDLRSKVEAANLGVPLAWPNEPFELPEPPAPFVAIFSRSSAGEPIELGGGVWAEDGTAEFHVAVPAGTGTATARALTKTIASLFRGLPPGTPVYRSFAIDEGSTSDDGLYWSMTLSVAWTYQDITT